MQYASGPDWWVLQATGPDRDLDFGGMATAGPFEEAYGKALPFTYDPTNGTMSSGDVFRFKQ
ncbi:MAG: hypothetical protein RLY93_05390 [Sumerlaeia bacterium]